MTRQKADVIVLDERRARASEYEYSGTGDELDALHKRVDFLEERLDEIQAEKASPENLYQSIESSSLIPDDYPVILKIRNSLTEGLEKLKQSVSEPDEILRESYIDLFFDQICHLTFYYSVQ
jgi:hypothetical protein